MPRGVRSLNKTVESQIAEIDARITKLQTRLTDLKNKRKELVEAKEKADFDALYKAVKESGMTPSELLKSWKTTA